VNPPVRRRLPGLPRSSWMDYQASANFQYDLSMTMRAESEDERWAGLYTPQGELARPGLQRALSVSPGIVLSEDRLLLPADCESGPRRRVLPRPGLLREFVRLSTAAPETILAFAQKWGMLGIWQGSHRVLGIAADDDAGAEESFPTPLPCTIEIRGLFPFGWYGGAYQEPLDIWRLFSAQARALLDIGSQLHEGKRIEWEDWADLFQIGDPRDYVDLDSEEHDEWGPVEGVLEDWLHLATARSRPFIPGATSRGRSARYILFAALAEQLSHAVAREDALVNCWHCGNIYTPERRPAAGKRNFCPDCRAKDAPSQLASRDYRRRGRTSNSYSATRLSPET
jgi:hypothetical protein